MNNGDIRAGFCRDYQCEVIQIYEQNKWNCLHADTREEDERDVEYYIYLLKEKNEKLFKKYPLYKEVFKNN